jgi:hypothetical protein
MVIELPNVQRKFSCTLCCLRKNNSWEKLLPAVTLCASIITLLIASDGRTVDLFELAL